MPLRQNDHGLDRRAFLQRAGMAAAAGAALPLLGSAPPALAAPETPDQLFWQGRFADAEWGYRCLLRDDPGNAHAHARIGYIALLSNRFRTAEDHLSEAVALAPGDVASVQRLAECFVRRDQLDRAAPLLRGTGRPRDAAFGQVYSQLKGRPWQISGARSTRVPFFTLDPVPSVDASINGGKPEKFYLDTYATLDLSMEAAEKAGVRPLASWEGGVVDARPVVIHVGILDSFRIGDIEIRNIPVQWNDAQRPPLPDGSQAAGAFGTTIFYHFLTTMDYAGRALLLRRTPARPPRNELARLPLWLAGDHFPCTLGSLGQHRPKMVTVDTGGIGSALDTTVAIAEQYGLTVDYAHPRERPGIKIYPVTAERISLGNAVRRNVTGSAFEKVFPGVPGPGQSAQFGFDLIANFTHEFFKPYAVTFDYVGMKLTITQR
ncbi:aspartyl protease family protein [Kribbella catacumbae]|uniref:aspartyl protease family protein n=1 Tax=Kribbella catacumbae TaxID=460086 RepID=UPI00037BAB85|nr:aspartyl protease family protein [Kribbella catacumbae]